MTKYADEAMNRLSESLAATNVLSSDYRKDIEGWAIMAVGQAYHRGRAAEREQEPQPPTTTQAVAASPEPEVRTFTVFAVYEDNLQPYATTVECALPSQAPNLAQRHADETNGSRIPLSGFQVVEGAVEVAL